MLLVMQKRNRRKKNKLIDFTKRGFTDKLYYMNFCCTWVFVAVCIVLTAIGLFLGNTSMDLIVYGIPACFAELGIHTGFIITKARIENLSKHKLKEEDLEERCID